MPTTLALSKKYKGTSLIEVLIALGFAMLVLVTLTAMTIRSIKSATFAKNNAFATKLAQDGMEWLRNQRDKTSWPTMDSLHANHCANDLIVFPPVMFCSDSACDYSIYNTFKRCIDFSLWGPGCPNGKKIAVKVTWTDSTGIHSSEQTTCLSNWQNR